jgi:DNA-binding MarR family transcriptional regulator
MELGKLIDELSLRMRLLRASQEADQKIDGLAERDMLLLELSYDRGQMTVSQIAGLCPSVSESTISTNITKLWRQKLVTKNINPENQRIVFVELTPKGSEVIESFKKMRAQRTATLFKAMEVSEEERQVMERVITRAVEFFDRFLKGQQ